MNDKPLILVDKGADSKPFSDLEIRRDADLETVRKLASELTSDSAIAGYWISVDNPQRIWKGLQQDYRTIRAAGGLVERSDGKLLFIYRWGRWDLPKGKLKKRESDEMGAVREVEEECGISGVIAGAEILRTYHTYDTYGELVWKETVWYRMQYEGNEALIPQAEEDITEAQWFSPKELQPVWDSTYKTIQDVMETAGYQP